jgi:deoxyribodipyrimidine photolyase
LPNPGSTEFSFDRNDHSVQDRRQADINADSRHSEDSLYETFSGPDGKFSVPTFEQLALQPATSHHRGGEDRALAILDEWLETRQAEVLKFEKPKTSPAAFDPPATTTLSPHLHFGTLSVRRFFWGIKDLAKGKAITLPPVSLIGQLYWREL